MITIDQFKKICREVLGEINCSFSENKLREDSLEDFTKMVGRKMPAL